MADPRLTASGRTSFEADFFRRVGYYLDALGHESVDEIENVAAALDRFKEGDVDAVTLGVHLLNGETRKRKGVALAALGIAFITPEDLSPRPAPFQRTSVAPQTFQHDQLRKSVSRAGRKLVGLAAKGAVEV